MIMAVMSNADRILCWEQWMRENKDAITGAMDRNDLKAAIDAADQWASDNASSFNTALPVTARTVLSASQKAFLLSVVLFKRYNVGA